MYVRLYIRMYVIYKSWLRGVFCVYTTWIEAIGSCSFVSIVAPLLGNNECFPPPPPPPPHAPSQRQGAYALQTSEGWGLRVVYTWNTPSNHYSCNIYANQQVQRQHFKQSGVRICDIYNLWQHRVMAANSVNVRMYDCTYVVHPSLTFLFAGRSTPVMSCCWCMTMNTSMERTSTSVSPRRPRIWS